MSLKHKAPNPEKGARYLTQLDAALCNATWSEVPELARKVEKHAPERKCLTLAARTEAHIASALRRPSSASSDPSASLHGLAEAIPKLRSAAVASASHPEDAYIANICIAEIAFQQRDYSQALGIVSLPFTDGSRSTKNNSPPALGWLEVCSVKSQLIKALSLEAEGRLEETGACFNAAIAQTPGYRSPQLRIWTERLLARACMHSFKKGHSTSVQDLGEAYPAFRSWSDFWSRAPQGTSNASETSHLDVPRRSIWRAYYDLLSTVAQLGLFYDTDASPSAMFRAVPGAGLPSDLISASRRRLRIEMKRVETTYESLLLSETVFPKASGSNTEVESWVTQVMKNWNVVCGAGWIDEDLEEGGKQTVSRVVLAILYRAATKTFHSPAILRHLFTVHVSLSEFDLALSAFDSYVEIVENSKARAAKTGKHEPGSDDDSIAVLTACEAVRVLCRYGDREQGEKATETAKIIRKWLGPAQRTVPGNEIVEEEEHQYSEGQNQAPASKYQASTLGAAYAAIGISQAHWAHLAYEAENRSALLADATSNLERALAFNDDLFEARYALALLSLESRHTETAETLLTPKLQTLLARDGSIPVPAATNGDTLSPLSREDVKHLTLISHLLSLCLTTRDDYEAAAQLCEAALDRAGFSRAALGAPVESAALLLEKGAAPAVTRRAQVHLLGGYEKEAIVETKKSEILFVEVMEGPEAAVVLTGELLGLVTQLFGKADVLIAETKSRAPPTAVSHVASHAPSRLGGTLRSIAGSIRPRSSARSTRSNLERDSNNILHETKSSTSNGSIVGPASDAGSVGTNHDLTSPIAITITNEDGGINGRLARGLNSGSTTASQRASIPSDPRVTQDSFGSGSAEAALTAPLSHDEEKVLRHEPSPIGAVDTSVGQQVLEEIPHNVDGEKLPQPPGHTDQPPIQDVRLPEPHPARACAPPEPLVSDFQVQRHHISVLVGTWLFIAELYIHAEQFANAQHALGESNRLLESLEASLAAFTHGETTARTLFFKGWNRGKSIDELWADLSSTRALLAITRAEPYKALAFHEEALAYQPDHPASTIGLANILLDFYEEKLPFEPHEPLIAPIPPVKGTLINEARPPPLTRPNSSLALTSPRPSMNNVLREIVTSSYSATESKFAPDSSSAILDDAHADQDPAAGTSPFADRRDPTPASLNLLACRDRAYMLLVALTKSGPAWNLPEAWLALARAHELSGNFARAKQTLWWVVELEDRRTARAWRDSIGPGGYTL